MKRFLVLSLSLMAIFSLSACQTEKEVSTQQTSKKVQSENLEEGVSVIRGTGAPMDASIHPMFLLDSGKTTIQVKVKGAKKSDSFSVAVVEHIEDTGTASGLVAVKGSGNFSKTETFEVPSSGKYDISFFGNQLPKDFTGKWEVIISQNSKKNADKKYEKQLQLAEITQNVGGLLSSTIIPRNSDGDDEGYGFIMEDFKILGENSISFQSFDSSSKYFITELKDGKWSKKEEVTGKTITSNNIHEQYDDFSRVVYISTTKGTGELSYYGGKYHIIFENMDLKPEEVSLSSDVVEILEDNYMDGVYWDFDNSIVYMIVEDKESSEKYDTIMYRYDLKKQQFVLDKTGKPETISMPFENTSERIRYSIDKKGNVYIAALPREYISIGPNPYHVIVAAFNKDMKLIAEPFKVNSVYDYYDKGRFEIAATDKGVDIWNVYDARILNNLDYHANPVEIGANHFSLVLK